MLLRSSPLLVAAAFAAMLSAQQDPPAGSPAATPATKARAEQPHFRALHWPADKDAAIAVVGTRTLTLTDLVDHLDGRHHPGFKEALTVTPTVEAMLRSDLMAPWVRHFADLEALRQAYGGEIEEKALEAAQSEALRQAFQQWLDGYVEDRKQQNRPTELTQDQVNSHLQRVQFAHRALDCGHDGLALGRRRLAQHVVGHLGFHPGGADAQAQAPVGLVEEEVRQRRVGGGPAFQRHGNTNGALGPEQLRPWQSM
jgi:hypothetical protein